MTKHGLYSKYTKHKLSAMIDKLASDENLLDLRQTIALQQALILDLLTRLESGALPYEAKLIETMAGIGEKLGRNIERLNKIEEGEKYILRIEEIQQIVQQVVLVIRQEVQDPETVEKIGSRLQELQW